MRALWRHEGSEGHERQFVLEDWAAGVGLLERVNWVREPVEVIVLGWCVTTGLGPVCALEPVPASVSVPEPVPGPVPGPVPVPCPGPEANNHMIKSISWHDLVNNDPSPFAVSRLQFPRT